jgi:hypothetical protein
MPDPAFDDIVSGLRADDPAFVRRLTRLGNSRPTTRLAFAVVLWALAPLCIVLGGWTGAILAVIAGAYGTHLIRPPEATHDRPRSPAEQ